LDLGFGRNGTMAITEAIIRQNTTNQSYARGLEYFHSGSVQNAVRRGSKLQSRVSGQGDHYRVSVIFGDGNDVQRAQCACPYCSGGWCKHIVATLLVYVKQPNRVRNRPTLDEMLAPLTPAQALGLLRDMVGAKPELVELVDQIVTGEDDVDFDDDDDSTFDDDLDAVNDDSSPDVGHAFASYGYFGFEFSDMNDDY
jgi:uncharacterized Zn finger protein